jgi:hypothetical protein
MLAIRVALRLHVLLKEIATFASNNAIVLIAPGLYHYK